MARGAVVGDSSMTSPSSGVTTMATNAPVVALVFLGVLTTLLGFFAAGNIQVVIIGLVAVFGAGLLQVLGARRA
jgi:hypothetical protein